jgi:hypothetical protein
MVASSEARSPATRSHRLPLTACVLVASAGAARSSLADAVVDVARSPACGR